MPDRKLTARSYRQLPTCEVCGDPLSRRGENTTGLCAPCRYEGAAFARAWATDLRDAGVAHRHIAHVVGFTSEDEARARVSDHRRREASRVR